MSGDNDFQHQINELLEVIRTQDALIADLHRRLERQERHASIFLNADTIKKYDKALEEFQIERDTYRSKLEQVLWAIRRFEQAVKEDDRHAAATYEIEQKNFADLSRQATEGRIAEQRIALLFHEVMRNFVDDAKRDKQQIIDSTSIPVDIGEEQAGRLIRLKAQIALTSIVDFGTYATREAEMIAGSPQITCVMIMNDLRNTEHVNLKLLEKLGMEWFTRNLPSPPSKFSTLMEGLHIRQKESMLTQQNEQSFPVKRM